MSEQKKILDSLIDEEIKEQQRSIATGVFRRITETSIKKTDAYSALKDKDAYFRKSILFLVLDRFKDVKRAVRSNRSGSVYHLLEFMNALLGLLMKSDFVFTDAELIRMAESYREISTDEYPAVPLSPLLRLIGARIEAAGMSPGLKRVLEGLRFPKPGFGPMHSRKKRDNELIERLLAGPERSTIDPRDPIGSAVVGFLESLPDAAATGRWDGLIAHLCSVGEKSAPTKTWLKEARGLVEAIGIDAFAGECGKWIGVARGVLEDIHRKKAPPFDFFTETSHTFLKALIWCAGLVDRPALHGLLDEYGLVAYRKYPGIGALSVRTGNACLYVFSRLPLETGIASLVKYSLKIKYPSVLVQVRKYIRQVSERERCDEGTLEELAVPRTELDGNGALGARFGDCEGVCAFTSAQEKRLAFVVDGKSRAGVPAIVKKEHSAEIKAFLKQVKETEAQLVVQRDRIERIYLNPRSWELGVWKPRYIDHALVGIVAKRLIWRFEDGTRKTSGIYHDQGFHEVDGSPIEWIGNKTRVELWHPIEYTAEEVHAWRVRLEAYGITQPFRQAHREVYILTDAERETRLYSNRFAAHVLRQHQFSSLCRQRLWRYTLQGQWDSFNIPFKDIPAQGLRVELIVEPVLDEQEPVYRYVVTDQVRFFDNRRQLELSDVPAMVFTEIMRDVDLFTGVCSIGNDPEWQDSGVARFNDYWREHSFGELSESAKIREEVLQRLVPKLRIGEQCGFEKRFLVVEGKLRTYKIHIGSGNILMSPNDRYLCIVPGGTSFDAKEKVFLPFEGDALLSLIISKAFLLAADDKIKDTTIMRQIRG